MKVSPRHVPSAHSRRAAALKVLAALCLSLLPATLPAQYLKLKLGGGLATQYGDARVVGAYKIGVGYEYEFDQHWTVTPSLLFYGKGWKNRDVPVPLTDDDGNAVRDESGEQVYSLMSRSTSANYVEIPVLFSYYHRLGESRYLVFAAGPYAALGVFGKVKTKGDTGRTGGEKYYYDANTFGSGGMRRFDAGVQALVGYQFPSGLTLGLEADFGMVRTSSDGGRNLTGLVSLSYKFD